MINYLRGDATKPVGDGLKIIAHVCNDIGAWGAGFTEALDRAWPQAGLFYEDWFRRRIVDPPPILGSTLIRPVNDPPSVFVANMIAQEGVGRRAGRPPIRYGYLDFCLADVGRFAKNNKGSVHMPRIGCGLAGGKWTEVEPIIQRTLIAAGVPTYVYDLA